jgi:hypothetical protein
MCLRTMLESSNQAGHSLEWWRQPGYQNKACVSASLHYMMQDLHSLTLAMPSTETPSEKASCAVAGAQCATAIADVKHVAEISISARLCKG